MIGAELLLYGGSMNWNYAIGILFLILIASRIALWAKFRRDSRGRRLAISTLQLVVVIMAAAFFKWLPNASAEVFLCALAGIVILSFIPAKKVR